MVTFIVKNVNVFRKFNKFSRGKSVDISLTHLQTLN